MTSPLAAQIAVIWAEMQSRPDGLVAHVERVLAEALALARRWDVDPERTELATWGHDLFRAYSPADQLRLAREAGLAIDAADEAGPVLLHGPLAAVVMRERFKVDDDEVLAAVRDHTLGFEEMPLLAKIILIADKVEDRKRRRTPVMKLVRRLAQRDLDLALLCWADWRWVDERTRGWQPHPVHWRARTAWVAEHHLERAMPARVADFEFEAAAGD